MRHTVSKADARL